MDTKKSNQRMEDINKNVLYMKYKKYLSSGLILRIHLVNFMNHANLHVDLSRKGNFHVNGRKNEKLAVIAGLVITLGGKFNNENHLKILKRFVKSGANYSRIEITISNAYELHRYSNEVTIRRIICPLSSTLCAINASTGQVEYASAKDFEHLLHLFQIDEDEQTIIEALEDKLKDCVDKDLQRNVPTTNITNTLRERLAKYGEYMPILYNEIINYVKADGLTKMPLGPLGRYFAVAIPLYRNLFEEEIADYLNLFMVDNKNDAKLLQKICHLLAPHNSPIIQRKRFRNQLYDVSEGLVDPAAGTIRLFDHIQCSNPDAMNTLIDLCQIEKMLITDSKPIAEHLIFRIKNVPKNFGKILLPASRISYSPQPTVCLQTISVPPARIIQGKLEN